MSVLDSKGHIFSTLGQNSGEWGPNLGIDFLFFFAGNGLKNSLCLAEDKNTLGHWTSWERESAGEYIFGLDQIRRVRLSTTFFFQTFTYKLMRTCWKHVLNVSCSCLQSNLHCSIIQFIYVAKKESIWYIYYIWLKTREKNEKCNNKMRILTSS